MGRPAPGIVEGLRARLADHAKACRGVAERNPQALPSERADYGAIAAIGAATQSSQLGVGWAFWVAQGGIRVVVPAKPVLTPLTRIAVHVVQPPGDTAPR